MTLLPLSAETAAPVLFVPVLVLVWRVGVGFLTIWFRSLQRPAGKTISELHYRHLIADARLIL
jgi:hypothetical protein